MSNILDKICQNKLDEIHKLKKNTPISELISKCKLLPKTPNHFLENLVQATNKKETTIISEIKLSSPSGIRAAKQHTVKSLATIYKESGAKCISVLTDQKYFKGHNSHIKIAKQASNLPILRKDFIIDPYQIYQSKLLGADAILLIMACLTKKQATELNNIAKELNLHVLTESHNHNDIEKALSLDVKLIGINNRNLKDLSISIDTTKKLSTHIPSNKIIISESGIKSKEDITKLKELNIHCFLIGTALMESKDIKTKFKELLSN